ncbi:MAG: hypothetical protein ABMA64_37940 [Myxococcota bacterium]
METERVEAQLAELYGSRPWLVASDVLQGGLATVAKLRGWGAPRCFVIAARYGTGDPPLAEDCEHRVLDLPPAPMMEAIQSGEAALRALPPEVQAAVDRFDPHGRMRVIGAIFSDGRPVAGRAFWGARPAAWRALEDKVVIDPLWDAVGVARAPYEIAPVERGALAAAAARLDRGAGTVWAGDATHGFHGGASYTCRVRDPEEADRAYEHLRPRCETARVMPFLAGVPCSIHGLVFPDHVVALRPAEMVTLRRPGGTGFLYARAATFWDPPEAVRSAMRAMVVRVGAHLRSHLAYRGAFTIDGVCTEHGFFPTELNPRVGAALGMMSRGFPFSFLHDALVEGVEVAWRPAALEAELLAKADAERIGVLGFSTSRVYGELVRRRLVFDGPDLRPAGADELHDVDLAVGPGPSGGYVSASLVPARTPVGPSIGPKAAALVAYTDRVFDTQVGPVEPSG